MKIARKTGNLEAETDEGPKEPNIVRVIESYFNLPNEYSMKLVDSDYIFTDKTCAIGITTDMNFRTALAADFRTE